MNAIRLDRAELRVTSIVAFAAIVVGFLASQLDFMPWSTLEAISILGVFLLTLLPAIYGYYTGSFDPFEPVHLICLATVISFVVVPTWLLAQENIVDSGIDYRGEALSAIVLAGVALLGLYGGYYPIRRARQHQVTGLLTGWMNGAQFEEHVQRWALIGLFVTILMFVIWFTLAEIPISALNALARENYYRQAITSAETNVLSLFTVRTSWPALLLMAYPVRRSASWRRVLVFLLWIAALILFVLSGNRGITVSLIFATAAYFYLVRGRRPAIRTILIILVVMSFFAGSAVLLRSRQYSIGLQDLKLSLVANEVERDLTQSGAATGMMILLRVFPEKAGFIHFDVFEELLYAPVPRLLWPDKPVIRDVLTLAERFVPRAHAPPFFGPYYAAFGFAGVAISMVVLGAVSAWIYTACRRRPGILVLQILLAFWLGLLWSLYHRGGVSWSAVNIAYTIGPIVIVTLLARVSASPAKERGHSRSERGQELSA